MADASSDKVLLRDVAIVGGGCYGTFYAGQLVQAKTRGKVDYRRLLVIDRDPACRFAREIGSAADRELVLDDWDRFFDRWLARDDDGGGDAIVPSPLMPHLMFGWLTRRARVRWPGRPVEHRPLEPAAARDRNAGRNAQRGAGEQGKQRELQVRCQIRRQQGELLSHCTLFARRPSTSSAWRRGVLISWRT